MNSLIDSVSLLLLQTKLQMYQLHPLATVTAEQFPEEWVKILISKYVHTYLMLLIALPRNCFILLSFQQHMRVLPTEWVFTLLKFCQSDMQTISQYIFYICMPFFKKCEMRHLIHLKAICISLFANCVFLYLTYFSTELLVFVLLIYRVLYLIGRLISSETMIWSPNIFLSLSFSLALRFWFATLGSQFL